jgi:hypothetical protein
MSPAIHGIHTLRLHAHQVFFINSFFSYLASVVTIAIPLEVTIHKIDHIGGLF